MLKSIFLMLLTSVWTTVCFILCCIAMLVTLDPGASIWIARRLWSPLLLWAAGIRVEVEGLENVDPKRPTIYASNHQSTADIPVLFMALPVNVRFVAKKQLGYVPLVGWYLHLARYPLVDRGNRAKAIKSLEEAGRKVRNGVSIIVYPEGTRSDDGRVLPFKKGPFALALKARVPICPVTIEGSGYCMAKNSWDIKRGVIRVKIGKPIDTASYTEERRVELMREVRTAIIHQSLEMGGKGGDLDDAVAEAGLEGIGRAAPLRQGRAS